MIGFFKNLFSEILSFFIGLFGGKKFQENKPSIEAAEKPAGATAKNRKRSGYFMELDESEDVKPLAAAAKTLETAKDAAAKTLETTKDAAAKTLEKVTAAKPSEPVAAAKPAKAEPKKTSEPSANAQAAAAKIELVQTAEGVKAVPAKREKAPSASTNGQSPTETTFAPKYLAPNPSSIRRRPGPSMNNFLDMARQIKTPG